MVLIYVELSPEAIKLLESRGFISLGHYLNNAPVCLEVVTNLGAFRYMPMFPELSHVCTADELAAALVITDENALCTYLKSLRRR